MDAEVGQLEADVGVESLRGEAVDLARVLGLVAGDVRLRAGEVVEEPGHAAHPGAVQGAHDRDDLVQVLGGHEAARAEPHPVPRDQTADPLALGGGQDGVPRQPFGSGSHRSGVAPRGAGHEDVAVIGEEPLDRRRRPAQERCQVGAREVLGIGVGGGDGREVIGPPRRHAGGQEVGPEALGSDRLVGDRAADQSADPLGDLGVAERARAGERVGAAGVVRRARAAPPRRPRRRRARRRAGSGGPPSARPADRGRRRSPRAAGGSACTGAGAGTSTETPRRAAAPRSRDARASAPPASPRKHRSRRA